MQVEAETYRVDDSARTPKDIGLGALTPEEYKNPFLVFQKAFNSHTLSEFDLACFDIVLFSVSPYIETITWNLFSPYNYLIKMMDASWLIHVHGLKSI